MSNVNIIDIEVNADETDIETKEVTTLNVRVPGPIKILFKIRPAVLYEVTGLLEKPEGLDNNACFFD
ncbi:10869_t:CDS:1, partial [Racocetra fulgida]